MIVLCANALNGLRGQVRSLPMRLRRLDEGDAYSAINVPLDAVTVPATALLAEADAESCIDKTGDPADQVRVIARRPPGVGGDWGLQGFVRDGGAWREVPVQLIPLRDELFSRTKGLIETDVVADRTVFVAGLGSVGSTVELELAKLGVGHHITMDHDRLEVANVGRHVAGLSDVGRYKTKALADCIREKNPCATVQTFETKVTWETVDLVRQQVRRADLVLCLLDGDEGRAILNKLCVEEGKPVVFAGAFRRAYGGQVLYVRPEEGTPCYQCFAQTLPRQAQDQEVASDERAQALAYSDRPMAAEPGLSNDIAPISQLVVKLALQSLLTGRPTTLRNLDEDLAATWYLWLNRREPGTQYMDLQPLGFNIDGFHILRWYGIDLPRREDCPVCGDYVAKRAAAEGITVDPGGAARFTGAGRQQ